VINTLSAREAEEIRRRLADRDLDVKPRTSKRSMANSVDWERVRQQLQRELRS
jgi:hypothetical protein